jgi:hypothetical protein
VSERDRFVVVGLARPRAAWFTEVGRWSTGAAVPVDFRKCVSAPELRAHLRADQVLSALLVDASLGVVDRDLTDEAAAIGCAVLVVDDGRARQDWPAIGVSAVLPEHFDRATLLAALIDHTRPVARRDGPAPTTAVAPVHRLWRGRLIAVLGAGGTGTSITAMAVAQGLGADPRHRGRVLLADFALDADQGVLHDAGDVVPGVQELVEAHRGAAPPPDEIRSLTFAGPDRPYALLLGLRRHRDWTTLRPRAVEAAIDGLRQAFTAVVCDCDEDLEGEDASGSIDVEDRNVLARTAVSQADVVVVTGRPTPHGVRRLVGLLDDVRRLGVDAGRVLPTIVAAPRASRARAELSEAVHHLASGPDTDPLAPVLFLPDRRRIDALLLDRQLVPTSLASNGAAAVQAVIAHRARSAASEAPTEPVAIPPGSIGSWTEQEAAG